MAEDIHTPLRFDDRSRVPIVANRRHNSHGTSDRRDNRNVEDKRRSQGRYPAPKRPNDITPPTNYTTSPAQITPSYVRSTLRESYFDLDLKKSPINAGLLAFLPGLAGCGLLVTAIVLANWKITSVFNSPNSVVSFFFFLFYVKKK